jgi:hypothetical protein
MMRQVISAELLVFKCGILTQLFDRMDDVSMRKESNGDNSWPEHSGRPQQRKGAKDGHNNARDY